MPAKSTRLDQGTKSGVDCHEWSQETLHRMREKKKTASGQSSSFPPGWVRAIDVPCALTFLGMYHVGVLLDWRL